MSRAETIELEPRADKLRAVIKREVGALPEVETSMNIGRHLPHIKGRHGGKGGEHDDGFDDTLPGEDHPGHEYGDEEDVGEHWMGVFGLVWRSIVLTPALMYAAIHWLAIHGGVAGSAGLVAGGITVSAMAVPIAVVAAAVAICSLPSLVRRAFRKR